MLVTIQIIWSTNNSSTSGTVWTGVGKAFNTDTHQIEPISRTYYQATLDPRPTDVPQPAVGALIYFECGAAPDYDRTNYYYAAGDTVTSDVEHNAGSCGWTPPTQAPPTCDLVLTVVVGTGGDTLVATVTGAHGTVTFSRDGGTTRQASGTFGPLVAGTYTITAYDSAPTDCYRTVTKTITPTVVAVLPNAINLPAVGFSRNPLALVAQVSALGRALLVELYAEAQHGAGQFKRQVQRLRPTDDQRLAELQLQDQLHALLAPTPPDLSEPLRLSRRFDVIRRYFVRVAEVQPASGLAGPALTLPTCTVLRGGLGWERARAGNYFDPLPADFLTWRPAAVQLVGRGHVVLLAALVAADTLEATLRVRCYARGGSAPSSTQTDVLQLPGLVLGEAATPFLVQAQVATGALPAVAYRVEVALLVAGVVQASRTYRLSDGYRHRQFIFLNSLGQWDTLSCDGPLSSKASVERTLATHLVAADYDPRDGSESVANVTLDNKVTVSSGQVSPAELEYLRELLLSPIVYEVGPTQQLRPIRLTSKELLDYQDDAGSDGFAFEYAYCFDTSLYEPERLTHF